MQLSKFIKLRAVNYNGWELSGPQDGWTFIKKNLKLKRCYTPRGGHVDFKTQRPLKLSVDQTGISVRS